MKYQYSYTSIVTGKKIKYNAMKVKHQRALIETAENILEKTMEPKEFLEQFKDIIYELINIDKKDLYFSDFEHLVFLIRAKSFGDIIEYTKIVDGKTKVLEFNISKDVTVIGKKQCISERIDLDNGETIEMTPLLVDERFSIDKSKNKTLQSLDVLINAIKARITNDEFITFGSVKEKKDYLDELSISNFKKIKDTYSSFPKISTKKKEIIDEIEVETEFADYETSFFALS